MRWFADHVQVELREGGAFRFWGRHSYGTPDGAGATQRITRLEPPAVLAFTWQFEGVASEVTLTARPADPDNDGARTTLELRHSFPAHAPVPWGEELVDDLWRLTLGNLQAYLRGGDGIVLPDYADPNPEIRLSIVIDAPRERVFRALIEPEALNSWVAAAADVDPRVGGHYRYGWTYKIKDRDVLGGPTTILESRAERAPGHRLARLAGRRDAAADPPGLAARGRARRDARDAGPRRLLARGGPERLPLWLGVLHTEAEGDGRGCRVIVHNHEGHEVRHEGHEVEHEGHEVGQVGRWLTSGMCCLVVAAATVTGQVAPSTLTTERVFGPEVATGPYKHPACVTDLANGDLYLVYYGGQGEYARDTAVFGSRLARGSSAWTPPQAIARDPFRSLGNGVVWQAPDGVVWLFYVVRYGATWSTSRIQAKVSRDNAATWSDAFMLHEGEGMMVRNRPIVLDGGDYLLPIYHEVGDDPETVGADSTSLFLRYQRASGQWKQTGAIGSPKGAIQPAVAEVAPGRLIAYNRRGGGYGPTSDGWLVRAESTDGGWTWTPGRDSAFPNPNAAVDFLKLKSGNLLLVYNDSMVGRTPLVAALSTDGDKSYPHRRAIAEGPGDFAYPIAVQTADGRIHVVYTSDGRRVVNHAVFTEEWVLSPQKR